MLGIPGAIHSPGSWQNIQRANPSEVISVNFANLQPDEIYRVLMTVRFAINDKINILFNGSTLANSYGQDYHYIGHFAGGDYHDHSPDDTRGYLFVTHVAHRNLMAEFTFRTIISDPTHVIYMSRAVGYNESGTPPDYTHLSTVGWWKNQVNKVANGTFDTDTVWSKETGWTIAGGVAHGAAGTASYLYQNSILTVGRKYKVTFDVLNWSAGQVRSYAGSGASPSFGTWRGANGTYTDILTAVAADVGLHKDADFIGDIDNVIVEEQLTDVTVKNQTDNPAYDFTGEIFLQRLRR